MALANVRRMQRMGQRPRRVCRVPFCPARPDPLRAPRFARAFTSPLRRAFRTWSLASFAALTAGCEPERAGLPARAVVARDSTWNETRHVESDAIE